MSGPPFDPPFDTPGDARQRPHGNCYWVLPGLWLAGEHPGADRGHPWPERIAALQRVGIREWLDLTEPSERLPDYRSALGDGLVSHRVSIADLAVPDEPTMRRILGLVNAALQTQRPLYLHCHGGIGRTGTVVGCWLREQGLEGDQALALLARKWQVMAKRDRAPESPETDEQRALIRQWPVMAPN